MLRGQRSRAAGLSTKSSPTDIVLDADRASEAAVVEILRREFPNDEIVAEEGGAGGPGTAGEPGGAASGRLAGEAGVKRGEGGAGVGAPAERSDPPARGKTNKWFVDPLDGTVNYFYGIPHSAVTVALEDEHGPACGAIADVWRDEIFIGARGEGAWLARPSRVDEWLDPQAHAILTDSLTRLAVRDQRELAGALVATGFGYVAKQRDVQARIVAGVLGQVRDLRRLGSASLDLAYVAAGRADAYFESVDKPWDWVAGALFVREAGGRVTELTPNDPARPRIVASAPAIHDALLELLARAVKAA